MRTLTLELLRHGPAHNQLLSPLTQYLALCENHPAVTLQLPLEHNQMLHRLGALSYRLGEASRGFQLQDTAKLMADLLAGIPGLTADMNGRGTGAQGDDEARDITHLRLVLSASELALLPFELTLSPPGCPGEGQPLLLQSLGPVCITRETRRVPEAQLVWPTDTRLLFIVASPAGQEPVPALAHLLALRQLVEPWVGRPEQLGRHLTVLSHASLEDIETACAATNFTHVHILAHGCEYADGYDTRFGLMLHRAGDAGGAADIVSGERLASALRSSALDGGSAQAGSRARLAGPSVVTLASCNSGAQGSVAGVGASIAHALHQAGIPLVIASQFPLSFGGSVRMVEALYGGLLWGEDPRRLLVTLRRQLHAQFPETHDWASLSAYSSLPADFEAQLAGAQIQRAMTSINVALAAADDLVARLPAAPAPALSSVVVAAPAAAPAAVTSTARKGRAKAGSTAASPVALVPAPSGPDPTELMRTLDATMQRVRQAKQRLQDTLARHDNQRSRILGLLASTEKREAALSHERQLHAPDAASRARHAAEMWASLARSRAYYFDCYALERTPYWTTQYLSLGVVLRAGGQLGSDAESPGRDSGALWRSAEVQALHDLASGAPQDRAWALGNLIELYLLAPAINALPGRPGGWGTLAAEQARRLVDGAAEGAFEVFSTRRQVQRYLSWYAQLAAAGQPGSLPSDLLACAEAVLAVLPTQPPVAWDYDKG